MTPLRQLGALLFLVLACAVPAYANNPPQPDGLFSVLLVFPVAIFAARLAGVATKPKSAWARFLGGLAAFLVATVFLATGTELGAAAALAVLIYAIVRGGRIMSRGASANRRLIGAGVIAFALFAFADYYVSIVTGPPSSAALSEAVAKSSMRSLNTAESEFAKLGRGVGSLKDLENANLIDGTFSGGRIRKGYRYGEFVDPENKAFCFYALPATELRSKGSGVNFVPGSSLVRSLFGSRQDQHFGPGFRSFSVDETGVLRYSVRTGTSPVTQEEVRQWSPL